jgi:hypothetical protein
MRRLCAALAVLVLGVSSTPAHAGDSEGLIIVAGVCGLGLLATGAVAGGLSGWENGAAKDVRTAGNAYRAVPTVANARRVADARQKWQDAHDFNSNDDAFAWIVGGTGFLAGTMCFGGLMAMTE